MFKSPPLDLVKAAKSGDLRARDRVVRLSIDFVAYIARDVSSRYTYLELEDCMQSGYIGVIDAIGKFDLSKGTQFFTYAKYCIQNSIQKLIRAEDKQKRISEKATQSHKPESSEPFTVLAQAQTNRALRRRIYAILKPFPKLVRKCVVLKLLGNSYVAIAKRFNISRHRVSAEVRRVLKILHKRLSIQVKRLPIRRTPSIRIKPGQITRPRPIPLSTVLDRLRARCQDLVRSAQAAVQRLWPVAQHLLPSSIFCASEQASCSSMNCSPANCSQSFAGQGLGIPPPPPE